MKESDKMKNFLELYRGEELLIVYKDWTDKNITYYSDCNVGCNFIQGKVISIKKDILRLEDLTDGYKLHELYTGILSDCLLFNAEHCNIIKNKALDELKVFTFHSLDHPKSSQNIYNIVASNDLCAFLNRENDANPLRLTAIQDLHSGMQFNYLASASGESNPFKFVDPDSIIRKSDMYKK
jgi:hypothetical protein